jgi:hypothetical protein
MEMLAKFSPDHFAIVVVTAGMTACAGDSRPPIIEEYTGTTFFTQGATLSSLSSDAAYRSAYVLLDYGTIRGVEGQEVKRYAGQFCPEPPPDVAQSISAAISAALEGKVSPPAGQVGGELAASYGEALATSVGTLLKRSQGLQFFRDRMFYTCVAYLTGALTEVEYKNELGIGSELAGTLIALELMSSPPAKDEEMQVIEADTKKLSEIIQLIKQNGEKEETSVNTTGS